MAEIKESGGMVHASGGEAFKAGSKKQKASCDKVLAAALEKEAGRNQLLASWISALQGQDLAHKLYV